MTRDEATTAKGTWAEAYGLPATTPLSGVWHHATGQGFERVHKRVSF